MQKLTKEQALAITGFTGIFACKFVDFHADVQERMGRPVFTREFANEEFNAKVQELYREDFMSMLEN